MWAITGADLITSVGTGREATFTALCNGTSGNRPLQGFDQRLFRYTRAHEIPDRQNGADVKGRVTSWLRRCVYTAVQEAEISLTDQRVALLIGTGLQELRSLELWWSDGQPLHLSELHFARALQQELGIQGPVYTIANACSASNFALGLGADLLMLDEADVVIIGGCDTITESMLGGMDRVTPTPPTLLQPFERHRQGVLMGEGAAAVVLEPLEKATARNKTPLAILRSVGMSCDAYHETTPHPEGMVAAMVDAYHRAAIQATDVDLIMIHGTGTQRNDEAEATALERIFGATIGHPMVSGIKSMLGHTSGASGLIAVIIALEAMRQGIIPPTINFSEPMEEAVGFHIVANQAQASQVDISQINAFGFGGVNAVAILERAKA